MIESEDNDSKTPGNNSDSVVLALFGALIVLSQGSAVAPFIYAIF